MVKEGFLLSWDQSGILRGALETIMPDGKTPVAFMNFELINEVPTTLYDYFNKKVGILVFLLIILKVAGMIKTGAQLSDF